MKTLSLSVLHNRDFRLLVLTRACATAAVQAQAVIVGWQVYSLTKDVFLLGLVGLVEAVPAIAGALVAGHVVDKIGKPGVTLRVCISVYLLNILMLLLFAGGFADPPGGSLLPWIFGGVFVSGVARSFYTPSGFSILPRLVARHDIGAAQAWMTSLWQIAAMTGPAVAGLIYGGYGPHGAWIFPLLLTSFSLFMASSLRVPDIPRSGEKQEPIARSIRAGWHFIFSHPVLLSVMTLDMFAVLFGGAIAMLPAYADQILHVGAEGLGALRAAPMLGAVSMSLCLAIRPMKKMSAVRLMLAVSGFGLCMIGFGVSTSFTLSLALLGLGGAFDSISVVMRGTMLQILTPEHMRGRVSAIGSMFIISSNEIGAFESGVAARAFGLVPSVVFGGAATLGVVAFIALASPKFRKTVVEA